MERSLCLAKDEDGVVATEFLIVAPLFLFLVFGTIQFMAISHADALMQYANFMALRAGAVHAEPILRGWDTSRTGPADQELVEVMEAAAARAMGPMHHPLEGYDSLARQADLPISHSPVAALDVRVSPGFVGLGGGYPFYQHWITSETEVDLGLGFPWVGRVIEAMYLQLDFVMDDTNQDLDESEAVRGGFDAMTTQEVIPNEHLQQGQAYRAQSDGIPFITMKSDAFLDLRPDNSANREKLFPFSATGGTYTRIDAKTFNRSIVALTPHGPQPMAMPIQARFRHGWQP